MILGNLIFDERGKWQSDVILGSLNGKEGKNLMGETLETIVNSR